MTPSQIAKAGTEHSHQAAFFCWISQQTVDKRLKWSFAVPNGGDRGFDGDRIGAKMKAEGQQAGVPDVIIPIPCGQKHSLYIEFKKPGLEGHKNGGLKSLQCKYRDYLLSQSFGYIIAYSYLQAIEGVLQYLEQR